MAKGHVAKAEIEINASKEKVWHALTDPEMIKQYLFGTTVTTDWKVGSPITYQGEWEGKKYEDKGKILEFEKEKKIVSTYWSSMSGIEDKPENYMTVTHEVSEHKGKTKVTITQDNNADEESAKHSQQNWAMVLGKMKELLESKILRK